MREISQRADASAIPDPKINPHTPKGLVTRGEKWDPRLQYGLYGLLFVGFGAFVVFLGLERWRRATLILGITMIYLGVLRQLLPDRLLGVMSVRSSRFDLFFCSLIGGGMVFLSASVDALGS